MGIGEKGYLKKRDSLNGKDILSGMCFFLSFCILKRLKRGAAPATPGGLGIKNAKSGACQPIDIIHRTALELCDAPGIHGNNSTISHGDFITLPGPFQTHGVLQPRAPSFFDGKPESRSPVLCG
jgi:hypothetical protein